MFVANCGTGCYKYRKPTGAIVQKARGPGGGQHMHKHLLLIAFLSVFPVDPHHYIITGQKECCIRYSLHTLRWVLLLPVQTFVRYVDKCLRAPFIRLPNMFYISQQEVLPEYYLLVQRSFIHSSTSVTQHLQTSTRSHTYHLRALYIPPPQNNRPTPAPPPSHPAPVPPSFHLLRPKVTARLC